MSELSSPLAVVIWRWGTKYGVEYANRIHSMLARHLPLPHQLYCVTDDPTGLDSGIRAVAMPDPEGFGRARRLRMFSPWAREFGSRILQLDIDCIIVGDLTPLVTRSEPFVIWKNPPPARYGLSSGFQVNDESAPAAFNTSMVLRSADALLTLWDDYRSRPDEIEQAACDAKLWTILYDPHNQQLRWLAARDDDQAVISLFARDLSPPTWGEVDGVFKWGRRGFADRARLPANARIVFANGLIPEAGHPWIAEHWR